MLPDPPVGPGKPCSQSDGFLAQVNVTLGQSDKAAAEHKGGLTVKVNITLQEEAPKLAEDKTCLPDRRAVIDVTEVRQANRVLEGPAEPSPPKSQRRMDAP